MHLQQLNPPWMISFYQKNSVFKINNSTVLVKILSFKRIFWLLLVAYSFYTAQDFFPNVKHQACIFNILAFYILKSVSNKLSKSNYIIIHVFLPTLHFL